MDELEELWNLYDENTRFIKETVRGPERFFFDEDLAYKLSIRLLDKYQETNSEKFVDSARGQAAPENAGSGDRLQRDNQENK